MAISASPPDIHAPKAGETVKSSGWLYLGFALVAGLVAAIVSWGFLSTSLAELGIPDPGRLTTAGLPFLRAAGWILAALSTGSFLAAAFLITPQLPEGDNLRLHQARLSVDGHLAARAGALSSLAFGMIALAMIPMTLSDVSGTPLAGTLDISSWSLALHQVAEARSWAWVAGIALCIGVLGLFARRWGSQPLLLAGSLITMVPLGLQGHSAAGGNHDYGTNSYLWHLMFMMLWVGGLIALIAYCRRLGPGAAVAVRRYSRLALISVIVMAISGIINAFLRVDLSDWFSTTYGWLVVTKTAGVIVLALFGFVHRELTIPKLEQTGNRRLFNRVAIVEVLVMAAIVGVAISMSRTPPPPPRNPNLSTMAVALGFDLTTAPTALNVFTMWRFDLMLSTFALILAGLYLWGLRKVRQAGKSWSAARTFCFLLGCAILGIMMSSGMGMNMMALFSMHMVVHMGLSMVVPVFLVLGAPLTLLMEAVGPSASGTVGLYEWTYALCHSRLLGWLSHPSVNTIQFIVVFYLLYLTPIYEAAVSEHGGHVIMNWLFLLSGYLYYWEMIGPDPVPKRTTVLTRLLWLLFSMPFHLYFGVYMMQLNEILGYDFYSTLYLPWNPDLLHDQKVGGGIMWASGSFPLLVVFGTLFYQWRRDDKAEEQAYEQKVADHGGIDEDLDAYNDWLASVNRQDG